MVEFWSIDDIDADELSEEAGLGGVGGGFEVFDITADEERLGHLCPR